MVCAGRALLHHPTPTITCQLSKYLLTLCRQIQAQAQGTEICADPAIMEPSRTLQTFDPRSSPRRYTGGITGVFSLATELLTNATAAG